MTRGAEFHALSSLEYQDRTHAGNQQRRGDGTGDEQAPGQRPHSRTFVLQQTVNHHYDPDDCQSNEQTHCSVLDRVHLEARRLLLGACEGGKKGKAAQLKSQNPRTCPRPSLSLLAPGNAWAVAYGPTPVHLRAFRWQSLHRSTNVWQVKQLRSLSLANCA